MSSCLHRRAQCASVPTELGLFAVNAWSVQTNIPSIRILERNYFRRVGTRRQCHYVDGQAHGRLLFDLLVSEHQKELSPRWAAASGNSAAIVCASSGVPGGGEKMLDLQTVENEVAEIFSQKLHVDVPSRDSDLFEAGILDSLHLVELILELEQQFCVRISLGETDLENFCTIERISLILAREYDGGSQD